MNFMVIGHRGACYYEPENTLRSFKKALKLKCKFIECDVHLTKDKEVVVIHDEKVDRTTNGKGFVKNFTLDELKKLDAGKKEKIPTLQEYINLLKDKAVMVIELKNCKNIVEKTLEIIKEKKIQDKVILLSFNPKHLIRTRKLNSKVKTCLLISPHHKYALKFVNLLKPNILGFYYKMITKNLINRYHKKGFKIFAYEGVNENLEKSKIKNLIRLGLDGIALNKASI